MEMRGLEVEADKQGNPSRAGTPQPGRAGLRGRRKLQLPAASESNWDEPQTDRKLNELVSFTHFLLEDLKINIMSLKCTLPSDPVLGASWGRSPWHRRG